MNAIGAAVERSLRPCGFAVCPDLYGHGVGRRVHEPPDVPHLPSPRHRAPLTAGVVITIEPVISAGSGALRESGDGWTLLTADGAGGPGRGDDRGAPRRAAGADGPMRRTLVVTAATAAILAGAAVAGGQAGPITAPTVRTG